MLRIVLFYGWIMQEKETPVIREGEKNVSLQSTAGVQGNAVLLPGSGERCLGDSVKGPQLTSPFSLAAEGGMHRVPEKLQGK